MPYIKPDYIERIKERQEKDGDLLVQVVKDFAEGMRREGTSIMFTCPKCGSHRLSVTPGK